MKKIKTNLIDCKKRFQERFSENQFKTILEILIIVTYSAFALLLPTTSYTRFHLIPFFVAGAMVALMLMWIMFYGKIYLDYPTIMMSLFLVFNVFSWMINGFKNFNQTIVILPFLFLFVYQYLKNTKTIRLFAYLTYLGYLFFAIVFSAYYAKELVVLDFSRLGDAFGNVNGIGEFFAIGFAFSLYYGIIKKKYHNLLFSVVLLFLSGTTGSKAAILLVAVSLVIVVIVRFGLKKWYITISIIVGFVILGAIILNIPAFSFLQERIMKMFQVLSGTEGSSSDGSTVSRLNMVYEGIYGFLQKPVFGWGHEGFRNEISSYGKYSHNNYIDLLSNYGLVGFLTFESIIFIPFFKYVTRKRLVENKEIEKAKKLIGLMVILSVFILFEQFTGVQSTTKEDYIFLALISAISTECYQKNHKTAVYFPITTRTLFSRVGFLKIEAPKTNESEVQIVSVNNLFAVLKEKFFDYKKYFLEIMNSIKNPDNKILLLKEHRKKGSLQKSDVIAAGIVTKQINKKEIILNSAFIIFLSIQGTLAFSFSFYNSKPNLLNSAIEIANKQQINNIDPYVSFSDIDTNDNYSLTLLKQSEEREEFKTLNPYLKFDVNSFSYNSQFLNLNGVTAKDLNPSGPLLKGMDLPIVFKQYSLEPLNGAEYAVMITSRTAASLLDHGATNFYSLIGETFVDKNFQTYSVNNIIYNDEITISDSNNINKYSAELTGLSNHLTKLNNDYVLYIKAPSNHFSSFAYSFAYFPNGSELIDYIEKNYKNYGTDSKIENTFKFLVLDESGQYTLSENYSDINAVYITYNQESSQIYQILSTVISVVLYMNCLATTFDISKKITNNKFLYIILLILLFIGFTPLILIRLFSTSIQIHVLANNASFIYLATTVATLSMLLLFQNIVKRIRGKYNKQN